MNSEKTPNIINKKKKTISTTVMMRRAYYTQWELKKELNEWKNNSNNNKRKICETAHRKSFSTSIFDVNLIWRRFPFLFRFACFKHKATETLMSARKYISKDVNIHIIFTHLHSFLLKSTSQIHSNYIADTIFSIFIITLVKVSQKAHSNKFLSLSLCVPQFYVSPFSLLYRMRVVWISSIRRKKNSLSQSIGNWKSWNKACAFKSISYHIDHS